MELKLTNYTIIIKEKITWKDVLKQEKILWNVDAESFDLLDFYIENLIESLDISSEDEVKYEKDKKKIEEIIYSTEQTKVEDLYKIIDEVGEYIKKKIK